MSEPIATIACESARLLLREFELDDAASLVELYGDPAVVTFLNNGTVLSDREIVDFIVENQAFYRRLGYGRWAVIEKGSGRLTGCCGVREDEDGDIVVNCHIVRRLWRNGYGSEALQAVIDYARRRTGRDVLYAYVDVQNVPSRRMLERLGFLPIGEITRRNRRKLKVGLTLRTEATPAAPQPRPEQA